MKTEIATSAPATTRVLAEALAGKTLDGEIAVTIKRHTLKGESKCAAIKRLLMTPGMTKDKLIAEVEAAHGPLKDSTLNTIRADLKRTLGGLVVCTGWRTDAKEGKLATAAVAKLRAHELGQGYASVELITAPVAPAPEAPASEQAPEQAPEPEAPAAAEATPEPEAPKAKSRKRRK